MSWNDSHKFVHKSSLKISTKNRRNKNRTLLIRITFLKVKRNCTAVIKFVILKLCTTAQSKTKFLWHKDPVLYVRLDYMSRLFKTLCWENRVFFHIRMDEPDRKLDQTMHRHLKNYSYFQELERFYSLTCDSQIVDLDL